MSETERKRNGCGIASLVLGTIGICTSWIPIINNLSFVMGLIGIIFGIIALTSNAPKGNIIAGIVLCILTILATINIQQSFYSSVNNELNTISGYDTEGVLKSGCDVKFGKLKVSTSYGIKDCKLPVTVTNMTDEPKTFSIQIEAVDKNGSRIETDYIYADNLNPGQSQKFDAFTLVTSDEIDDLEDATFKVVEASMY